MKINIECKTQGCQNRLWTTYYSFHSEESFFLRTYCPECVEGYNKRQEEHNRAEEKRIMNKREEERNYMRHARKVENET